MTPAAAGAHHVRGQRRMAPTTAAPPAPANAASRVHPFARSPAQPRHDWVTRPTSIARLRDTADSGSWAALMPTASAAPAAAPASTGRRRRRRRTAGGPERPATSHASMPASNTVPASESARWGRRNARDRAISSGLK